MSSGQKILVYMQGVTKRCRLSWRPIAPSYMSPNARGGGGFGVSANEYSCAHGAQINFGDLTSYLTYVCTSRLHGTSAYFIGKKNCQYTVKRVDEVVRHPHLVTQDQNTQVSNKVSDISEENFTKNI